jgi:hypothetical protein
MKMNADTAPAVGREYQFYDDGKVTPGRRYTALVKEKISVEESKKVKFDVWNGDYGLETYKREGKPDGKKSLYECWREEIDGHRQGEDVKVLNGGDTSTGSPWLYAEETDWFVRCSILDYDDDDIWFVRTVWGGWFSLDIQNGWQGGELDVDGSRTEWLEKEMESWK